MGRMFGQLIAYVCVATVITQALGLGYAWSRGKINGDKLFRMVAVAHDVDLSDHESQQQSVNPVSDQEEMSYEQKTRLKAITSKDLDLKLQALEKGIENLAFDQRTVKDNWDHYERIKAEFEQKWAQHRGSTQEAGLTNVRLIWEKMKRGQAKDNIMRMVERGQINDVVILISGMPNDKRSKIVKDFSTEKELEVLTEILELILRGDPANATINAALDKLQAIDEGG